MMMMTTPGVEATTVMTLNVMLMATLKETVTMALKAMVKTTVLSKMMGMTPVMKTAPVTMCQVILQAAGRSTCLQIEVAGQLTNANSSKCQAWTFFW